MSRRRDFLFFFPYRPLWFAEGQLQAQYPVLEL